MKKTEIEKKNLRSLNGTRLKLWKNVTIEKFYFLVKFGQRVSSV